MNTRDLRKYTNILRTKCKEILEVLPDADVKGEEFRTLVINFNNAFSNIQQYTSLIQELEDEKASLTNEE